MAEKILDKKGQKTPVKGSVGSTKPNEKGGANPNAGKKGDHKKK